MDNNHAYPRDHYYQLFRALLPELIDFPRAFVTLQQFIGSFQRLSAPAQRALYLNYYCNYKLSGIAADMALSTNQVCRIVRQARAALRRDLFPEYYTRPLQQFFDLH